MQKLWGVFIWLLVEELTFCNSGKPFTGARIVNGSQLAFSVTCPPPPARSAPPAALPPAPPTPPAPPVLPAPPAPPAVLYVN